MLSVGALTISIGSLFHEMGSLIEKAALYRSKRKLRWRNLKSFPRMSRSAGASKEFCLRQIRSTAEYIVGQDEKPAAVERKDIQSTKPILVWLIPHALDHTSGKALYALHRVDVSA